MELAKYVTRSAKTEQVPRKLKKARRKKKKKKIGGGGGGIFFITSTITSNLFLAVPEVLALRTVSFIPSVRFQNNHSDRPF